MNMIYLVFTLGFCAGILVNELLLYLRKYSGVLHIDRSNPDKDVYRMVFDDLDKLHKKKFVILKINPNADLSQK